MNFAVALLKSDSVENKVRGVALLKGLYDSLQRVSLFFSDTDKDLIRFCLYELALGYYLINKFGQSQEYAHTLLQLTPNHQQVKALLSLIEDTGSLDDKKGKKKTTTASITDKNKKPQEKKKT
eukprot:TRINITY_DN8274_c0_g1_i1.p1 TRINITY_DN8274_c0_g1~~TRINITY_DN8274_c0_g1_i1.p1  ORF type:complete len:123 (+),score=26.78 TRINITY_DN8274_c0_g1_i1:125-493(+)